MVWNLKQFADTLSFFGVLPIINLLQPAPKVAITVRDNVIFDFTQPKSDYGLAWGSLDDVVMGGSSQSNLIIRENSALFTGIVSTANGGDLSRCARVILTLPSIYPNFRGWQAL